jgi:hypothetical protein
MYEYNKVDFADSILEQHKKIIYEIVVSVDKDLPIRFESISQASLKISDKGLKELPEYLKYLLKYYGRIIDSWSRPNGVEEKFLPLLPIVTIVPSNIDIENQDDVNDSIDPRCTFIDSCIWLRYIVIKDNWQLQLKELLKEINLYYELGLYNTQVAFENLDKAMRWLKENHLHEAGPHAADITPIVYHSETRLRNETAKIIEKIHKQLGDYPDHNKVWNCLLIDDHCNKSLNELEINSKTKNVKEIIGKLIKFSGHCISEFIELTPVADKNNKSYIDECIKEICNTKTKEEKYLRYEIILLDYLLKYDERENYTIEMGTKFLEKLQKGEFSHLYPGPSERYWILPITAHNSAFQDDMVKNQVQHYNEKWYIAEGADVVMTPNKFLWLFFSMLLTQLKEAMFNISDFDKFFDDHKLLNKVPIQKIKFPRNHLQLWAIFFNSSLLNKFAGYSLYFDDDNLESGFVNMLNSYFNTNKPLKYLYRHFLDLVRILSSGSPSEFDEALEYCMLIENLLADSYSEGEYKCILGTINCVRQLITRIRKEEYSG